MTLPRDRGLLHHEHHDKEAPFIVLVPGLDGTALLFYRQIPLLAREFNVVAFPLPNDPNCTMASLVEDLKGLIDQLAGRPVLLCGESFGGALSMSFGLTHPDRLLGLVIVNSFPVIRQWLRLRLAPPLLRILPWGTMRLVRRFTESRLHSSHVLQEDLDEFHERMTLVGRNGYIRRLEILQAYDIRERLGGLEVPVLYLAGDEDRLVPSVREGRFMTGRVPDSRLQVLEGYGHCCLINHDLNLLDLAWPWFEEKVVARKEVGGSAVSAS